VTPHVQDERNVVAARSDAAVRTRREDRCPKRAAHRRRPDHGGRDMCLNCGCGQLDERHGNKANITATDVRRAGDANGQDLATSARNMQAALSRLTANDRATAGAATAAGSTPAMDRAGR
jgi:hypothetical protein